MAANDSRAVRPPMTVYSKPSGCIQCDMTYKVLAREGLVEGVHYSRVDITEPANADQLEYITEELGYAQAPVVVINARQHWSGFRPDQIKRSAQWVRTNTATTGGPDLDGRQQCRAMDQRLRESHPSDADGLPSPADVAGQGLYV
ncbi:glutaredoxin domain-containing protein [Ruania zhangjianzhongii]|uniref:glutaredoxin domain-containing protein n=1 Tax=Ruania zhangjianzhongii TaxID=2603206 RepID=UPI0031451910